MDNLGFLGPPLYFPQEAVCPLAHPPVFLGEYVGGEYSLVGVALHIPQDETALLPLVLPLFVPPDEEDDEDDWVDWDIVRDSGYRSLSEREEFEEEWEEDEEAKEERKDDSLSGLLQDPPQPVEPEVHPPTRPESPRSGLPSAVAPAAPPTGLKRQRDEDEEEECPSSKWQCLSASTSEDSADEPQPSTSSEMFHRLFVCLPTLSNSESDED